jgi:CheY-like chemotaxis protein
MLLSSLEDEGFLVLGADGADGALAQLERGHKIDALITDLSMPGKSGWDLVRELQSRRPDLPIVMLTGHVGDDATEALDHPHGGRFLLLQKPVAPDQLARRLAGLIAGNAA